MKKDEKMLASSLKKKIAKICGTPEEFCYEYVIGAAGMEEGIRRMKEYLREVNKVIRSSNKKLGTHRRKRERSIKKSREAGESRAKRNMGRK